MVGGLGTASRPDFFGALFGVPGGSLHCCEAKGDVVNFKRASKLTGIRGGDGGSGSGGQKNLQVCAGAEKGRRRDIQVSRTADGINDYSSRAHTEFYTVWCAAGYRDTPNAFQSHSTANR